MLLPTLVIPNVQFKFVHIVKPWRKSGLDIMPYFLTILLPVACKRITIIYSQTSQI